MDIKLNTIEIIKGKLIKYEMCQYSSLKPSIREYLFKIETEIQYINQERKTAIEIYKSNKVNVSNIVKKIGIARQTVYNKNNRYILEPYILKSQEETEKNDVFKFVEGLNEKINLLNKTILKLQKKDLNDQICLNIIGTLENENSSLISEVEKLDEINIQNIKMIKKLEQKINKGGPNLLDNNVIKYDCINYNDKK
ncbi:hypothetical protein K9O30_14955 [Clostridium bowmanii]|uniref:hypothetical protein n=1 Tax=Clostridium bowmanii TaxID=132925 RepID=UPI001C0C8A40|nr:hypothetical protein [Clostridium bowmanii]MBU3190758.1 hypothetical protein [Clostridium bowmanii]MCA1074996.1 hypothetical protein [Clostridium bowmanii]